MTTIFENCHQKLSHWRRHDGDFGVEIETESYDPYSIPTMRWWHIVPDGSLRYFGMEYVTELPVTFEQLGYAIEEFDSLGIEFIQDSVSTSVHVHRNVLNFPPIVVANAATAYAMLEPVLCKFAGLYRESNLFCLQLRDAPGGMQNIINVINFIGTCGSMGTMGSSDQYKYAAFNVGSFWDHGSFEFRAMRGVTDTDLIKKWIQIIDSIFEYASTKTDPEDVLSDFMISGTDILDKVFKDHTQDLEYEGWYSDVEENFWFGWKITSIFEDWTSFGEKVKVKISRREAQIRAERRASRRLTPIEEEMSWVLRQMMAEAGSNERPVEGETFEFVDNVLTNSLQPSFGDSPQPFTDWEAVGI